MAQLFETPPCLLQNWELGVAVQRLFDTSRGAFNMQCVLKILRAIV
jgi:hypothetical protein